MKRNAILITLLILVTTLIVGCQKEKEMEEIPPIPIKLSRSYVKIDTVSSYAEIAILNGNGGYKIIYPKTIFFLHNEYNYSENIIKVETENNKILIERTYKETNGLISGWFIVVDVKNQKELFNVDTPGWDGGISDFIGIREWLLSSPELWLNWQ